MECVKYQLGDICKISSGQGAPQGEDKYTDNGTPFIKAGNLHDLVNGVDEYEIQQVSDNIISSHRLKLYPAGSVVFAKSGASCLKGYVYVLHNKCCVVSHLAILTPKEEGVYNPQYLCYYLRYDKPNQLVSDLAYPAISLTELSKFSIVLPSTSKQSAIVSELDKIQAALDNKKEQLKKLDELIQAKFYEMFGDPVVNDKGWKTKTYGEIFTLFAGGTPSKTKNEYWENGTISWIGSNLCQNVILYNNDGKFITDLGLKKSSAKLFPSGTVLIALVGATIGKTALLKFETTTNQNVLGVLGIKDAGYNPLFVFYYTQGLHKFFLEIGDGGFAMASKTFVSKLPIFEVDKDLQQAFAAYVEKVEQAKTIVNQEIAHLQELLNSRMDYYFRK